MNAGPRRTSWWKPAPPPQRKLTIEDRLKEARRSQSDAERLAITASSMLKGAAAQHAAVSEDAREQIRQLGTIDAEAVGSRARSEALAQHIEEGIA